MIFEIGDPCDLLVYLSNLAGVEQLLVHHLLIGGHAYP